MNAPLATCLSRAIIASVTMVSLAFMFVNGLHGWESVVRITFGLGSFLMIPVYRTKRKEDGDGLDAS